MAKRKKPIGILKILFIIFAVHASFSLISLQLEISDRKQQIEEISSTIAEQKIENDELTELIEGSMQDENMAKIAREKLDYVMPGERVFVDTSSK